MPRLFVAVWPPPAVTEQVAALPRPEVAGLKWTRPDQWHVTLRFLGGVADEDVPAVQAALVGVGRRATAVVGPAVGRFGRRVVHVPVAGLDEVAAAVVAATREFGELPDDRPFAGHLTLARAKGRGVDLRPYVGATVVGEWPVDELTLVESRLSRSGAEYQTVARFRLSETSASTSDADG